MNRDDPDARRLVRFCTNLPQIDGEPGQAKTDTQWVLQQFQSRRDDLSQRLASSGAMEHERPALRCEIDAIDAAASVITQVWQRRFGTSLHG